MRPSTPAVRERTATNRPMLAKARKFAGRETAVTAVRRRLPGLLRTQSPEHVKWASASSFRLTPVRHTKKRRAPGRHRDDFSASAHRILQRQCRGGPPCGPRAGPPGTRLRAGGVGLRRLSRLRRFRRLRRTRLSRPFAQKPAVLVHRIAAAVIPPMVPVPTAFTIVFTNVVARNRIGDAPQNAREEIVGSLRARGGKPQ